jgi:tRNA modification GTPase
VETSATKATGLADLKKAVMGQVLNPHPPLSRFRERGRGEGGTVTNSRHVAHLEKAARQITQAQKAVKAGQSEEALSIFIRQALQEIGGITGEAVTEDVLASIFSQFCVGK